jgi:hypothetical protein
VKTNLLLVLAFLAPLQAEQWKTQFFYDKDRSSLEIRDLQCPSPTTCVATAALIDNSKNKPKGALVTTSDGGEHWQLQDQSEIPYSLFFLNASNGWMVTDRGVWQTQNAAKTWKKLTSTKGIERLWFLDPTHGFAVAEAKTVYETKDGGKEWTKIAIPEARPADPMDPRDVVFFGITFEDKLHGAISGSWNPMQLAQEREWLEMNPAKRPKLQMSALLLETGDGGKTWNPLEVRVQGKLTRLRLVDRSSFLLLVEYLGGTEIPSELFRLATGQKAEPLLHAEGRVARDVIVLPGGETIVAAVELAGKSNAVPIPGKLRIMQSRDLRTWPDEKVDYRAVAMHPILAAADRDHVWVATDAGMILRRMPNPTK